MLVSLLVLALVISGCTPEKPVAPPAPPPPAVTVVKPVTRALTDQREFPGRTQAAESVAVRSRVGGYLREIGFREGAAVKKGDLLFEIDPAPFRAALRQAKATLAAADAKVKTQDLDVARYQNLYRNGGLVSRQLVDQTVGARAEARSNRAALEAAVERAQLELGWTRITAPIAGIASRAQVTRGNLVVANETVLTTIVSTNPMHAYFDVDEATVLRARRLTKIPVEMALAGEEGFPHAGTIDFVENALQPGTGTLQVRGVFPNSDRALAPGLFARVRFALGAPEKKLLVPEQALSMDQRGEYVKVVKPDGTVEDRVITTGRTEGSMVVVERGLRPDEPVIVAGLQKARPGAKVHARLAGPERMAVAVPAEKP